MKGKTMFEINTEVLLASDFVPSNDDEEFVYNGSLTGRIVDISHDDSMYLVTFDDTEKVGGKGEYEPDVCFWVDVDQVELA